jgi:hypothetical protein
MAYGLRDDDFFFLKITAAFLKMSDEPNIFDHVENPRATIHAS